MNWPQQLVQLKQNGEPFVVVTVSNTRGSTPRETGAKMFVTADSISGTIGGGQLEHECTAIAAKWLCQPQQPETFSRTFTLGADCGQCCGGVAEVRFDQVHPAEADWIDAVEAALVRAEPAVLVTTGDTRTGITRRVVCNSESGAASDDPVQQVADDIIRQQAPALRTTVSRAGNLQVPALFEPLHQTRFQIVVFGAGHVGSALVATLAALPCQVSWVDNREGIFPTRLPENVTTIETAEPATAVEQIGSGACYVVMTHSHAIDLDICARVLQRDNIAYCGLIGSRSKRRQFEKRLRRMGIDEQQLARLTCPIGIDGISGKRPGEIAVAVAAQLLQLRERVAAGTQLQHDKRRAQL
ncbi:MAG: xanthine dehydrogenase accessory protein XdhC [Gammaproteobacteria bacterium]|nr:xanthine dehydrogenase accessory protein XdhC [Gammaproteobacteria bacterium]NNM20652.1 xanthine dehydrogenase accessory protein XdhC [Gammaproteobacteria bacterium]